MLKSPVRPSLAALALLALVGACASPTPNGAACKADGDCNVIGQRCVPTLAGDAKACAKGCKANLGPNGCPNGFDCGVTDQAVGPTCNAVRYGFDAMTGAPLLFGKSCAVDANACNGTGDANASPQCRKGQDPSSMMPKALVDDPNAYCTGSCETNADCPSDFRCDTDYDMVKKCLRRSLCDECVTNDSCPKAFPLCVPASDGTRYCTRPCASLGDCPGAAQAISWMDCKGTTDAEGASVFACMHRYGSCVGDKEICAPCRSSADCKMGTGCFTNDSTLERFCTRRCANDGECASPHAASCNRGDRGALCIGDGDFYANVFSCWPEG